MKTTSISTLNQFETSRAAITRNQSRLAEIEVEVSTGRHADVGRTLGVKTSRLLEMRNAFHDFASLQSTNGVVATRLEQTQTALAAVRDLAEGFLQTALTASQGNADRGLLVADAKARLSALADVLNTTSNGAYVFGGTNASTAPFENDLAEPTGAGRAAVLAAFTSEFGFTPDDPLAASITPSQMRSYLDGTFMSVFQDPSWSTSFSSANNSMMIDRVYASETIETSVSGNATAIRKLVQVLTAAVDSGTEQLNAEAFSGLTKMLIQVSGEAGGEITGMQSRLGIAEERLAKANSRIVLRQNLLERWIGEAESVDVAKSATSLSIITSQLEASYAVTTRLQKLSLLNYLPL